MNEKSCRRCGLDLYEGEKTCPGCGARVRIPGLHWYLLFLALFLLFYLLLSFG